MLALLPGLPLWFFLTALLYAMVGFGGGSTYTALLAMSDTQVWRIPMMALLCNITVVAMGSWLAIYRRGFDWRAALPFFIASVPMAFLGGLVPLRDATYLTLLAVSLLLAGLQLLLSQTKPAADNTQHQTAIALGVGAGLGLLSGMVGIGGGIFLAPILFRLRWANAKDIASLCSVFILVNSVAGLAGQLAKHGPTVVPDILSVSAPLRVAVAIGGLLGGRVLLERVSHKRMRQGTACLIIIVALRLLWQVY